MFVALALVGLLATGGCELSRSQIQDLLPVVRVPAIRFGGSGSGASPHAMPADASSEPVAKRRCDQHNHICFYNDG